MVDTMSDLPPPVGTTELETSLKIETEKPIEFPIFDILTKLSSLSESPIFKIYFHD
jgi:hypothetical protein